MVAGTPNLPRASGLQPGAREGRWCPTAAQERLDPRNEGIWYGLPAKAERQVGVGGQASEYSRSRDYILGQEADG